MLMKRCGRHQRHVFVAQQLHHFQHLPPRAK
jgi:hypothetical protein